MERRKIAQYLFLVGRDDKWHIRQFAAKNDCEGLLDMCHALAYKKITNSFELTHLKKIAEYVHVIPYELRGNLDKWGKCLNLSITPSKYAFEAMMTDAYF